jgi:hypothetical protein
MVSSAALAKALAVFFTTALIHSATHIVEGKASIPTFYSLQFSRSMI